METRLVYFLVGLVVGNKYSLTKKHTSLVSIQKSPFMKKEEIVISLPKVVGILRFSPIGKVNRVG